jgi:hypothetical protein
MVVVTFSPNDEQRSQVTAYPPEWMAISLANAGRTRCDLSKRGTPPSRFQSPRIDT